MAEFCACGSLMINGDCTKKSCSNKAPTKSAQAKAARTAKALLAALNGGDKKVTAPRKARKSSKCTTYNLSEEKEEVEE